MPLWFSSQDTSIFVIISHTSLRHDPPYNITDENPENGQPGSRFSISRMDGKYTQVDKPASTLNGEDPQPIMEILMIRFNTLVDEEGMSTVRDPNPNVYYPSLALQALRTDRTCLVVC